MIDDNFSEKTKDTADAVKGVLQEVPVYKDVAQPTARELGDALHKTVRAALMPLRLFVWGVEELEKFIYADLAEELRDTPTEQIVTPNPAVAVPTMEALRYTGEIIELRHMYAKLLATSMDRARATDALPSFVGFIKEMSPDEARILKLFAWTVGGLPVLDLRSEETGSAQYKVVFRNFSLIGEAAGCETPALTPSYLDNLCRMGLLEIPSGVFMMDPGVYEPLENAHPLQRYVHMIETTPYRQVRFHKKLIWRTSLGTHFSKACIFEKGQYDVEIIVT